MKLTTQQETSIRISALIFPAIIVMFWVSEAAGDGDFAMAGLGGLVAAIVMGVGYFLFQKQSLKVQVTASVSATIVLLVVMGIYMNSPRQQMKRAILGEWKSVPREDALDVELTMWFATGKKVQVGFESPRWCEYEITSEGELVLTERMRSSRMKIEFIRNDSMQLISEEGEMLLIRD